jgi:amino-acid N-acetyltransferase
MEIHRHPPIAGTSGLLAECGLPVADLEELDLEQFFACGPAGSPLGVVGLELLGDAALLRSLAVRASARRRGCGGALLEAAQRHAAKQGVRELYLLTDTAEAFFRRRGFGRVPREQAPGVVRATREFSALCPDSAVLMVKVLEATADDGN